jgi:hypothetical protein
MDYLSKNNLIDIINTREQELRNENHNPDWSSGYYCCLLDILQIVNAMDSKDTVKDE